MLESILYIRQEEFMHWFHKNDVNIILAQYRKIMSIAKMSIEIESSPDFFLLRL